MNCHDLRNNLDDYLDGRLDPRAASALAEHAESCPGCAARLREAEGLRQSLRDLPVPPPSGDLLERAVERAAEQDRRHQRAWSMGGLAVAASLLLAVAVGLVTQGPTTGPAGPAVVAVTPGQTERINLAFNSPSRLEEVTLSVTLPEGVELAGHPGKRRLSWRTSLEAGRNLLELPVIVRGSGGVLRADLEYGQTRRSFDLRLHPQQPDRSGLASGSAV
jgi:anti-sigma factor RsiW